MFFLGAAGLHRTWDLRGYTGNGLARLSGRKQAYGYRYAEAFLSQVAHAGGAERVTDALAHWMTDFWHPEAEDPESPPALTAMWMDIASLSPAMCSFPEGEWDARE